MVSEVEFYFPKNYRASKRFAVQIFEFHMEPLECLTPYSYLVPSNFELEKHLVIHLPLLCGSFKPINSLDYAKNAIIFQGFNVQLKFHSESIKLHTEI